MQTSEGPVLAASVSVSPYVICAIDSVGRVLLVSPIPSDSYNLLSPSSTGFFWLLGEGPDEDLQFRLSTKCLAVGLPICSHLLRKEASLI